MTVEGYSRLEALTQVISLRNYINENSIYKIDGLEENLNQLQEKLIEQMKANKNTNLIM